MPIAGDVRFADDVRIFLPELVNLYGCTMAAKQPLAPLSKFSAT
jgi:hypothetical protein